MINEKEAYKIVKQHNPKMKASLCNETADNYEFALVPEDLAPGDGYGSGVVYVVDKKTGEYKECYFLTVITEPIIREIDIKTLE